MLEVVLHTDMSKHFAMVSKAELFAELHTSTIAMACRGDAAAAQRLWAKGDDRTFAMALLLHAADVSNPAKPLAVQEKWAHKVMQEFFQQGDRELELGLPISPGFDRRVASLPSSQLVRVRASSLPLPPLDAPHAAARRAELEWRNAASQLTNACDDAGPSFLRSSLFSEFRRIHRSTSLRCRDWHLPGAPPAPAGAAGFAHPDQPTHSMPTPTSSRPHSFPFRRSSHSQ